MAHLAAARAGIGGALLAASLALAWAPGPAAAAGPEGSPEPAAAVCEGDACQGIVLPPDDPTPGTASTPNEPNPPPRFVEAPQVPATCKKGFVRKLGHCIRRPRGKHRHGYRRASR